MTIFQNGSRYQNPFLYILKPATHDTLLFLYQILQNVRFAEEKKLLQASSIYYHNHQIT